MVCSLTCVADIVASLRVARFSTRRVRTERGADVRSAQNATIEDLRPGHWPEVARIYLEGIETGHATFETEVPSWEIWDEAHLPEHRFVALSDGLVVGWVAVSPVSDRCVYGGVVEDSVYVSAAARGLGIGRLLLDHLIRSTEAAGVWTIQSGMFPENTASITLHERVGFETVGRRKRLGKLHGEWRDVLLMERRSDAVD
jgi:L-amino acid N-acyltransferase YncA